MPSACCSHPAGLDLERASKILGSIHAHDIDFADFYFQHSCFESWSLEEGIVKAGTFNIDRGVGVRAVTGDKQAFAYSDDISPARARRGFARGTRDRPAGSVGVGCARSPRRRALLYPTADPVQSLADAAKVDLLLRLEGIARSLDPRVVQVMASLAGEHETVLIARSDGLFTADVRPLVRVSISVIVEEHGRREQGYAGGGARLDYGYFTPARLQSLAKRGGRPGAGQPVGTRCTGRQHDGRAGQRLARHPAARGDRPRAGGRLQPEGNERVLRRIGQRVASPGVTVVDDGTLGERRGSLNLDDEGNPTQRTVLIEDGILRGYMQDRLNAGLMSVRATGNGRRESFAHLPMPRMTNTIMLPGAYASGGDHRVGEERASTRPISAAARSTSPAASSCSPPPRRT